MPAIVESSPVILPAQARRPLTREDCRALEAAGLLEYERYELNGVLVRKLSKSRLHSIAVRLLVEWLRRIFGTEYVDQEVAIDLRPDLDATNQLEPDVTVLNRPALTIRESNRGVGDIVFVAEVSVTTREYDLGAKAAKYASAGIAEYWVLDLRDMRIVVHRNPAGEKYASIVAYADDEPVTPLAAAEAAVRLRDLVGADE